MYYSSMEETPVKRNYLINMELWETKSEYFKSKGAHHSGSSTSST